MRPILTLPGRKKPTGGPPVVLSSARLRNWRAVKTGASAYPEALSDGCVVVQSTRTRAKQWVRPKPMARTGSTTPFASFRDIPKPHEVCGVYACAPNPCPVGMATPGRDREHRARRRARRGRRRSPPGRRGDAFIRRGRRAKVVRSSRANRLGHAASVARSGRIAASVVAHDAARSRLALCGRHRVRAP